MNLLETVPLNPEIARFVDKYQYYDLDSAVLAKAIPNGKIEAYILLEGGFNWFDYDIDSFIPARPSGYFPMSNQPWVIYLNPGKCINIKLHPTALGLSYFQGFFSQWKSMDLESWLGKDVIRKIKSFQNHQNKKAWALYFDELLFPILSAQEFDKSIGTIVNAMLVDSSRESTITDVAENLHLTPKTLERTIQRHFNLSPKNLWKILRFQQTSQHLHNHQASRLIDALQFGYYDQSHFIKECRKMTGYSPKDFFSRLKLPTNDLMFEG
jgi:AraC-like DNA-binding protein